MRENERDLAHNLDSFLCCTKYNSSYQKEDYLKGNGVLFLPLQFFLLKVFKVMILFNQGQQISGFKYYKVKLLFTIKGFLGSSWHFKVTLNRKQLTSQITKSFYCRLISNITIITKEQF